jgi:hypothetical protein
MKDVVGSIDKIVLAGTTFRVAADADFKDGKPAYKNEAEETTGGTFRKMTKQSVEVESVSLKVNGDELATLQAIAESPDDITMAYVTAAGDTYRASGFIDFDGRQTQSGKVEIKLFPRQGWTLF